MPNVPSPRAFPAHSCHPATQSSDEVLTMDEMEIVPTSMPKKDANEF